MSLDNHFTAAMAAALTIAFDGGSKRLIRWPGGYWVGRHKRFREHRVVRPYTDTPTVRALIARGYLRPVTYLERGDPWIVELTEKALEIVGPTNEPPK